MGDSPTIARVTKAGNSLLAAGKPTGADDKTPSSRVNESFNLAKAAVYVPPISDDNDPAVTISPRPDANYKSKATAIARSGHAGRLRPGQSPE
jgi:hypothetical protein